MKPQAFAQLRWLLSSPPSVEHFHEILEMLQQELDSEVALEYAEEHLWDDAYRVVQAGRPESLWPACPHGAPPACFRLARALDIKGTWLDASLLAQSPHLQHLTRLQLRYTGLSAQGVQALCSSPHLQRLTSLDLSHNRLGDEGAKILAASPTMATLQRLHLKACSIGDEGAVALVRSPYLQGLSVLELGLNGELGPAAHEALGLARHLNRAIRHKHLSCLEAARLRRCALERRLSPLTHSKDALLQVLLDD